MSLQMLVMQMMLLLFIVLMLLSFIVLMLCQVYKIWLCFFFCCCFRCCVYYYSCWRCWTSLWCCSFIYHFGFEKKAADDDGTKAGGFNFNCWMEMQLKQNALSEYSYFLTLLHSNWKLKSSFSKNSLIILIQILSTDKLNSVAQSAHFTLSVMIFAWLRAILLFA